MEVLVQKTVSISVKLLSIYTYNSYLLHRREALCVDNRRILFLLLLGALKHISYYEIIYTEQFLLAHGMN